MFFAAHLVILSSSVLAFNQTTAKVPLAVSLPPLPPPSVTAGVFPIDQVRRGLHGVAYTVFEGTQPEPMSVEILGVLHNYLGPGQDLILSRLTGAKPEYTGVVAGMSGSPVYIDGKLLGALSYRIGVFSKEPIAGITPIQQMLQVRDQRSRSRVSLWAVLQQSQRAATLRLLPYQRLTCPICNPSRRH
jgi:hypothetical protein